MSLPTPSLSYELSSSHIGEFIFCLVSTSLFYLTLFRFMPAHIIRKRCTCTECVERSSSGVLMEARLIPAHLHRVKSMRTALPQSTTTPTCESIPSDADGLADHLLALTLTDNGPDLNSQVNKLWDSRTSFQAAGPSRHVIDGALEPISMSDIAGSINRLVLQDIVTPKTITITNLNTARKARCNHTWECRLALVGSNIVVTLGHLTVHGSCDPAQGWWRYDHSKTTTTL